VVSRDEPEYLKALREDRQRRQAAEPTAGKAAAGKAAPSPAEREAVRWAREVVGRQPFTVAPSLSGARCAALIQPISILSTARITLEGLPDRDALLQRVKRAIGSGENVLGCYEITTGRPLALAMHEGKPVLTPGEPRKIPKAASPEEMIRRAAAQAEQRAKARKTGGGREGRRR
jgi:hypothetical protein